MDESAFVDSLRKTIKRTWPDSADLRAVDRFVEGIPDVLAWIPLGDRFPWSIAIEAKSMRPLMPDPYHRGRRTGLMLKHTFSGPQISMLRALKRAGVDAFGLVRASEDLAFRIEPSDIPAATGNFTHEELLAVSTVVPRRKDGVWQFWRDP